MNFFIPWLLFSAFLLYLALGIFSLKLNPRAAPNRLFFGTCLCFAQWAVLAALMQSTPSKETALLMHRWSSIGGMLFTGLLAHFFAAVSGRTKKYGLARKLAYSGMAYIPAAVFIFSVFSGRFGITDIERFRNIWIEILDTANAYLALYWIWLLTSLVYSMSALRGLMRGAAPSESRQAKTMFYYGLATIFSVTTVHVFFVSRGVFSGAAGIILSFIWVYGIWRAISVDGFLKLSPKTAIDPILDSLHDGIILTDEEGIIRWVNPSALDLTSYSESELRGKSVQILFGEDAFNFTSLVNAAGGDDLSIRRKDSSDRHVSISLSPIMKKSKIVGYVFSLRDNSRTKEAEEDLKSQVSFITAVMDNLPIGIAVNTVKPHVRFLYMNDKFPKIYGTTREKLSAENSFWEVVYEDVDFREELRNKVENDCASGDPERMSWEYIPVKGKGKKTRYISANNIPVPGNDFMVSTVRDVTAEKLAVEALKSSEQRFKDMANAASEYLWEIDPDGRYVYLSSKVSEVLKRPVAELIGKTPFDFMAPEEAKRMKGICDEIFSRGQSFRGIECASLLPDGSVIWQSTSGRPVFNEKGELKGYRGTSLNVTEKKESQLKIDCANREKEILLSNITSHIWYMQDAETYGYANKAHLEFLGRENEEISGKKASELMSEASADEMVKSNQSAISSGRRISTEQWILDRNGRRRLLGISKLPIFNDAGDTEYLLCSAADITEKKAAEEEIQKSIDLKENLISMISHELRTPLTIIKEGVSVVAEGVMGALNPRQEELLKKVDNNVERLAMLISNVLDFQKISGDEASLNLKTHNLNHVVMEASDILSSSAREKNNRLSVDLDDSLPSFLFDREQITMVVLKLIENAIKFTESGEIVIKTKLENNSEATLAVKDTGRGMDSVDGEKIFDLFEQGRDIMTDKPKGVGMGLAITKKIIERHGGKITVLPDPKIGTAFCISLPVIKSKEDVGSGDKT